MDSFEFNKLIAGVLGTLFVMMSIGIVSNSIFAAPTPEKPGFLIEAAEEDAGGGPAGPAERPAIAALLAAANAEAGAASFKAKCGACHTAENGGANKVGPNLWNVVNRPLASHEGFGYSAAMKEFSQGGSVVWDYDHLDHFLFAPKAYIKGTAMGFAGLKKDDERGNVIAYLRTLSDSPAPLPEPAAAEAPAAEGAVAPGGTPPAEGAAAPAETPPAEPAAPQPAQ